MTGLDNRSFSTTCQGQCWIGFSSVVNDAGAMLDLALFSMAKDTVLETGFSSNRHRDLLLTIGNS